MTLASSAPTRAASRRAASAARSSSRRASRAASAAASRLAARGGRALGLAASRCDLGGGRRAALLELRDLLRQPLGAVLRELLELRLERGDALGGAVVARVLLGLGGQRRERGAAAGGALGQRRHRLARGLEPHRDPLVRGAGARGSGCSAPRARRRGPRARARPPRAAARPRAARPRSPRRPARAAATARLGLGQRARRAARAASRASVQRASSAWRSSRSCSSAASAWRLSGRSRVRASRSTSSARSRLSCVRSSLSCARRRRLRCLPSPAASSISSRRSRGLRGHDLRDPALRDDRVHLLAQAGVAEQLEHVGEPAAGAVDAVLAVARAVEPAHDRDLRQRQVDRRVRVVEHDLDLGLGARLHAVRAGEDHVLHRLAADGDRRLLAHRPQHGVGHVRLARAVRARRSPRRRARSRAACGPGTT